MQDGPPRRCQRHEFGPCASAQVKYDNIQLITKVFIMDLQDEEFPDVPLITTKSGLDLSNAASVRATRAAAAKAGIPTTRTIHTSVHEKLVERTPGVSGAQSSQQYYLRNCTSYSCMGGGARWQSHAMGRTRRWRVRRRPPKGCLPKS